jgi:hypothetical protein
MLLMLIESTLVGVIFYITKVRFKIELLGILAGDCPARLEQLKACDPNVLGFMDFKKLGKGKKGKGAAKLAKKSKKSGKKTTSA